MALELKEEERGILKEALVHYLDDLREEIGKTEKQIFKTSLIHEEEVLKDIIKRLS